MIPKLSFAPFALFLLAALLSILSFPNGSRARHVTTKREDVSRELTLHNLLKRAPPVDVSEGDEKGRGFMCELSKSPDGSLESSFTEEDLDRWFSDQEGTPRNGESTLTGEAIPEALAALGLPKLVGEKGLRKFNFWQDQMYDGNDVSILDHCKFHKKDE